MLTIKKTDDIKEISDYLKKHGIVLDNAPKQYMAIYDKDVICGLGCLTLSGAKVYLDFVHSAEDASLIFSLAKALLNMADLRGIQTVYGQNPDLENMYTALRFKKEDHEFALSLEGYFTVPCAH